MNTTYKLGSLFDGIGGFPLAGKLAGMMPVWASEIEPFPIRVTEKRLQEMKHYGDIHGLSGAELEQVDVVTFGSPCQDLSIAGRREGLSGERSGLFYEAIRVIREMRCATNEKYPRWAVWENVPGALSSHDGEDFRQVLQNLVRIKEPTADVPLPPSRKWAGAGEVMGDGYSLAWRVVDAQYWGVPQRRRRIFLVVDFTGECAGEILFERDGLPGHSEAGREARKGAAPNVERSATGGHCADGMMGDKVVYSIQGNVVDRPDGARCNGCGWSADGMFTLNTVDRPAVAFMAGQGAQARGIAAAEERSPTLRASVSGDNRAPCIVYPDIARTLTGEGADASPCADRGQNVIALNCRNLMESLEISGTLQAKTNGGYSLNYINPVVYDCRGNGDGQIIPTITGDHENRITDYSSVICMAHGQQHAEIYADKSPNLTCKHEQPIVFTQNQRGEARDLRSSSGSLAANPSEKHKFVVRRLTPLECGRLQGFPDGWCDDLASENPSEEEVERWQRIFAEWDAVQGKPRRRTRKRIEKWLKRPNSDSAEYKAYGNSVAVPCVFFVLAGIVWAMEQEGEGCP